MTTILDQFEVEYSTAYSGSYTARLIEGDFNQTYVLNSPAKFGRKLMADHTSGSQFLKYAASASFVGGTVLETDIIAARRNQNLGTNFRYSFAFCGHEIYDDSIVPTMSEIHVLNGGKNVYSVNEGEASSFSGGNHIKIVLGYADTKAVSTGSQVSDDTWLSTFPFQNRYSNIRRSLSPPVFSGIPTIQESIIAGVVDYAPSIFSATSSAPSQFSIEFLARSGSGQTLIHRTVCDANCVVDFNYDITSRTNVFTTMDQLFRHYYGIGDGFRNQVESEKFTDTSLTFLYYQGIGHRQRGWKYGLYNAFPSRTKMVFSRKHHGYLRDIFEQRQFTKIYDPIGINADGSTGGRVGSLSSPVQIVFVSGSAAAITASNPQVLNTRESGQYHFEGRTGIPFFDPT